LFHSPNLFSDFFPFNFILFRKKEKIFMDKGQSKTKNKREETRRRKMRKNREKMMLLIGVFLILMAIILLDNCQKKGPASTDRAFRRRNPLAIAYPLPA
jgi:hypothetical protein